MKKLDLITGLVMMGMAFCCLVYVIARHDDMVVVGCFAFMFLLSFFGGWGCLKDWAQEYRKQKRESEKWRYLKEVTESRNFKEWEKVENRENESKIIKDFVDDFKKKERKEETLPFIERRGRRNSTLEFLSDSGIKPGSNAMKFNRIFNDYRQYAFNHGFIPVCERTFSECLSSLRFPRLKNNGVRFVLIDIDKKKGGLK